MIPVGEQAPDVRFWAEPRRKVSLHELAGPNGALLLFYLFDWSST
jgi:peroxiredoxin